MCVVKYCLDVTSYSKYYKKCKDIILSEKNIIKQGFKYHWTLGCCPMATSPFATVYDKIKQGSSSAISSSMIMFPTQKAAVSYSLLFI